MLMHGRSTAPVNTHFYVVNTKDVIKATASVGLDCAYLHNVPEILDCLS
jgi:hypothetical protein